MSDDTRPVACPVCGYETVLFPTEEVGGCPACSQKQRSRWLTLANRLRVDTPEGSDYPPLMHPEAAKQLRETAEEMGLL